MNKISDLKTKTFYNNLALNYRSVEKNWEEWLKFNESVLKAIIKTYVPNANKILDAAAGVGSQTLALESLGFDVTASD